MGEYEVLVKTLLRIYELYRQGRIDWYTYVRMRRRILKDFLERERNA